MTLKVIVAGLGQVGRPLLELASTRYETVGIDVEPVVAGNCDILHICYPFNIDDFVEVTARYMNAHEPSLTIINSTVAPGTTRCLFNLTNRDVVHSPIRGKHWKMQSDLLHYKKFIGALNERAAA